ncbi:histidine phosphatase family protein [Streptomyces sp. NPDC088258]|uniref:histidine phosphatase family protein n=1 Tax=Streptomyces sp. NPDC088258 TaxID=3365849 RepID=UPI0037FF4D61
MTTAHTAHLTTRVLLISPAMSTALREARFPGPTGDDDLDATGLRQAEAVREDFPRAAVVRVSPTRRCRSTAQALGLTAGPLTGQARKGDPAPDAHEPVGHLPVGHLPDGSAPDGPAPDGPALDSSASDGPASDGLAPCAMGHWQGRTLDEVAAADPQSVAAWLSDPAAAPHGGESLLDFHVRVAAWLEASATDEGASRESGHSAGSGRRVIAVAEPDVIRAAVVHAIGAPPSAFWRIDVRPLSATELSGRNGRWNLLSGRPLHI